jgi:hypothetical protein
MVTSSFFTPVRDSLSFADFVKYFTISGNHFFIIYDENIEVSELVWDCSLESADSMLANFS